MSVSIKLVYCYICGEMKRNGTNENIYTKTMPFYRKLNKGHALAEIYFICYTYYACTTYHTLICR